MAASPAGSMKRGLVKAEVTTKNVAIGVELDGKGMVKKVANSSVFLGLLFSNDVIISIGDKPVQTTADFFNAARAAMPGKIQVVFERDEQYSTVCKKIASIKPGTELFEITLTWRSGGNRIGLLIHRDFEQRVVVAVVEDGGAASNYVKPGDYLVKINGTEIKDREQARMLILDSINKLKKVAITVERPAAAKSMVIAPSVMVDAAPSPSQDQVLTKSAIIARSIDTSTAGPRSIYDQMSGMTKVAGFKPLAPLPIAPDVLEILRSNAMFYSVKPSGPGILVSRSAAPPASSSVSVMEARAPEEAINYDPSPKELKATPKRVGS